MKYSKIFDECISCKKNVKAKCETFGEFTFMVVADDQTKCLFYKEKDERNN